MTTVRWKQSSTLVRGTLVALWCIWSVAFADSTSWQTDYRAKLTEIATTQHDPFPLLVKLAGNQSDEPSSSEAYANKRVLLALRRRLHTSEEALLKFSPDSVRAAARAELLENSPQ